MSEGPARLKYHQATFDLLGEKPAVSAEALDKITGWERLHGATLPGSLREWYSLEWVAHFCSFEPGNYYGWMPAPLDDLLRGLTALRRARKKSQPPRLLIGRPDDLVSYHAHLDGSEDPAVFASDDDSSRGTLSEFLFRRVWECLPEFRPAVRQFGAAATEPAFGGMELDFLADHFQEGPREVLFGGLREMVNPFTRARMKLYPFCYYFFQEGGRVHVSCHADPAEGETEAHWQIDAPTKDALARTVARVWPCGTLSQTLTSTTAPGKAVLKELRSSP